MKAAHTVTLLPYMPGIHYHGMCASLKFAYNQSLHYQLTQMTVTALPEPIKWVQLIETYPDQSQI